MIMAHQSIITQVSRDSESYQPAPAPDRGDYVFACCLCVCLFVCLTVCAYIFVCIRCLYVCLSVCWTVSVCLLV